MARTWLRIKVDLLGGGGVTCDPTPGRIFIVGRPHKYGRHSFDGDEDE
jgi:hypothetical protein